MKSENLVICDSSSQKREFIDDDVIMFVYLVWSHYDHDQAGCVALASLPQPRPLRPGARTIFAAVQLSLAQPCLERVRTQGKLTVETRKIGSEEKNCPLTLLM